MGESLIPYFFGRKNGMTGIAEYEIVAGMISSRVMDSKVGWSAWWSD